MVLFNRNNFFRLYVLFKLMRVNKLIGFFLLLWPTLWALWLCNRKAPDIYILFMFTMGVFFTRSFGCIINDCIDKDIDRYVKRTSDRPISCGIVSVWTALIVFFILILVSFIIMVMIAVKIQTVILSFIALLLICFYPYTKRCMFFPQFFLGVTFGCSTLIVFSVLNTSLYQALPWLLFVIGIIWTMIYDTEYAMVDRDDDIFLGIQSSAVFLGDYERLFIGILQLMMLFLLIFVGLIVELSFLFYFSLIGVGVLFGWQQILIYNRDKEKCFQAFLVNNYVGFLIFCGIFMDLLL